MKKRIIILAVITIAVCLLAWRLWPHSFSKAMPVDEDATISFSAIAMVSGMKKGQAYNDTYCLEIPQSQSGSIGEILEILDASDYRQDYRNLLPWGVDSVDSDRNYDGNTVSLLFVRGNKRDHITFLSNSLITVSTEEEYGFRIYHPTNQEVLYNLVEYVQTHGTKQ